MSLIDFQKLLVASYTNATIRDSFLKDTELLLNERNLTEREKKALHKLAANLIDSFSTSLLAKKNKMLNKILLQNTHLIVLSSWHILSPAIFFINAGSNKMELIEINNNQYWLLKSVGRKISPWKIMRHYFNIKHMNLSEVTQLTKIIHNNNLWGKYLLIR